MVIDPNSLAEEMSEDLSPSDVPDDLGSLSDDDLFILCERVSAEWSKAKRLLEGLKSSEHVDERETGRMNAIIRIKRQKQHNLVKELDQRGNFCVPEELDSLPFGELHELRGKIISEQRSVKKRISRHATVTVADHDIVDGLCSIYELRKGSMRRLEKEFRRRKKQQLDRERFLVSETSDDPAELEDYINGIRDKFPSRYPTGFVATKSGKLLVIWRTKEPYPEDS